VGSESEWTDAAGVEGTSISYHTAPPFNAGRFFLERGIYPASRPADPAVPRVCSKINSGS